jgi:hypothetical protein
MSNAIVILSLLALTFVPCLAQKQAPVSFCKPDVFRVLKPLPKLSYACPEGLNDSDEKILKLPERSTAIKSLEVELALFTDEAWWQAKVDDLDACDLHGNAGELTNEEREKLKDGDYTFRLFGNQQLRLVLVDDPCYQSGFSGSNAFLLYRTGDKVFVSEVLDGYYSRIDNSLGMDAAKLDGQTLIEISTANNMPPAFTNYYFEINPKTNRAIPKKIFKIGGRLTNKISSAIVFGEQGGNGAGEKTVLRRNHLAPVFSVYVDDYRGKIDDGGRKLRRVVYRWNGRFYSAK